MGSVVASPGCSRFSLAIGFLSSGRMRLANGEASHFRGGGASRARSSRMDASDADRERRRRTQRSAGITAAVLAFFALALMLDGLFGCRLVNCKDALMANVVAIMVTIMILLVFYGIPKGPLVD